MATEWECKPQDDTKLNQGIKGGKVLEANNLVLQHWKVYESQNVLERPQNPRVPQP